MGKATAASILSLCVLASNCISDTVTSSGRYACLVIVLSTHANKYRNVSTDTCDLVHTVMLLSSAAYYYFPDFLKLLTLHNF